MFIGTSTSGILETELAYRERDPRHRRAAGAFDYGATHNSFSVGRLPAQAPAPRRPAMVISCACASSAKVFGSARRMIEADLIDAAVVGGVDSLCLTTLYGFHSLQLCSAAPCRPFDVARDGISIGEAAAFALLERVPGTLDGDDVLLLGIGESSDAYHMSAPHPEGLGARRAMQAALSSANLEPGCDRLHQPARNGNAEQRPLGKPGRRQPVRRRRRRAVRPKARPAIRSERPARWKRSSVRWRCRTA